MGATQGILDSIGQVLSYTWWFWFAVIFFPIFESTWIFWRQEVFKHDIEFVLLEIRIPRETKKSPMAMEQVLTAIHALRNIAGDLREKWWDGEVTRWYSLEIVSLGGETHFYVRTYAKQRNLVEAAFFSYYPDVEMVEVEDYTDKMPHTVREMNQSGYDLWGSELVLARPDAYPIKSYLDFESPDEDKQYDPISVFLEVFSKVQREETLAVQLVIAPVGPNWKDKWDGLIEELRSKKTEQHGKARAKMTMEFPHILPVFPVSGAKKEDNKQDSLFARALSRTPGETDVLKAIEENLSKPAFHTIIRFIYLSPREMYYDTFARRGVLSAFNQYGSLDLNLFERNESVSTRVKIWHWPHVFPGIRNTYRKQRLLYTYRHREIPPETVMGHIVLSKFFNWEHTKHFVLNTRSLATLFHPPTAAVLTAPHIKRVESRKTGPPAGLSIYGAEEEIEKYK